MAAKRTCPKCGAENPAQAGACLRCGFLFVDPGDLLRVLWTEPALRAAKWGGLAAFVLGLALLFLLHGSHAIPALLIFGGALGGFWHFYARMKRA